MRPILMFTVLVIGLAACSSGNPYAPQACTEIGCVDQLTATIHDATGGLPAGMHTLEVTADGVTTACSFVFPLPPGPGGATAGISCPAGLSVQVTQHQTCVTSGTSTYKTQTCTPTAGKFDEVVAVAGKPATIHLRQTIDGATFLDETTTPAYQTTRPNGPGCEPICSQAAVQLTLTPPP